MRYNNRTKKTHANALPDDVEALEKMVLDLQNQQQAEAMQWKRKFYHLLEKWQLEHKKRFAASSEGLPGQGDPFNEIEHILQLDEEEVAAAQRNRSRHQW